MKNPALILFILILSFSAKAQTDTSGIDKFFEDGGLSNPTQFISFVPSCLLQGELSFRYDRHLFDNIYLEIGGGPIFPFYVWEPLNLNPGSNENVIDVLAREKGNMGYAFHLYPRYLIKDHDIATQFVGLHIRHRKYSFSEFNWKYTDYTIEYKIRYFLGSRILLEYDIGIGLLGGSRFDKLSSSKEAMGIIGGSGSLNVGLVFIP